MLRIHHDVIRDARVVKALSGSVMLLYTTESELIVMRDITYQHYQHYALPLPREQILSVVPVEGKDTIVVVQTADTLQLYAVEATELKPCQSLRVQNCVAFSGVVDVLFVLVEEAGRLVLRMYNSHTNRRELVLEQFVTIPGPVPEHPHYQLFHDVLCTYLVVVVSNRCYFVARQKGMYELVTKSRAFPEPIVNVTFSLDSFRVITHHAIYAINHNLEFITPIRSIITNGLPVKILSLRVFQRVLKVSHPAITGECVLLLLLLQFHGYVDFVLSIFLDLMKAEARRLDEEQLLMPTEEKRRGCVSIAHTFCSMFPPPCTMSVEALDLMISLFDRIDCVEMDAEEIALLLQVLRIYRQMKRLQAGGYIDRHGIQFLFYVLLLAAEILPLSSVPYSAVLHACISESKDALVKEACVVLLKKKLGVVDDAPSTPVETESVLATPPAVEGKYSALFTFSSNRYHNFKCAPSATVEAFDTSQWESKVTWAELRACHFVMWNHSKSDCTRIALKLAMVVHGGASDV